MMAMTRFSLVAAMMLVTIFEQCSGQKWNATCQAFEGMPAYSPCCRRSKRAGPPPPPRSMGMSMGMGMNGPRGPYYSPCRDADNDYCDESAGTAGQCTACPEGFRLVTGGYCVRCECQSKAFIYNPCVEGQANGTDCPPDPWHCDHCCFVMHRARTYFAHQQSPFLFAVKYVSSTFVNIVFPWLLLRCP